MTEATIGTEDNNGSLKRKLASEEEDEVTRYYNICSIVV